VMGGASDQSGRAGSRATVHTIVRTGSCVATLLQTCRSIAIVPRLYGSPELVSCLGDGPLIYHLR
jgi:hypothetical protein